MSIPSTAPRPERHALGLPAGSIRAILTLMVVGLVCALMLIPPRGDRPIPLPPYLLYLLFMILGHYFAARGHPARAPGQRAPLFLPSGVVRLLIIVALAATIGWKLNSDPDGFQAQFEASVDLAKKQPLLPVILLGGFFLGVLIRVLIGRRERPAWF